MTESLVVDKAPATEIAFERIVEVSPAFEKAITLAEQGEAQ